MNCHDRPFPLHAAARRVFACLFIVVIVAGCSTGKPDAASIELGKTPYPESAPYADDLDIVATQKHGTLYLDNRTPNVFKDVQLWVNQQYVGLVPEIEIGHESSSNTIDLTKLVNRYGEAYPIGGFFTPDKTFPVVLVEVFDPASGKRHRLLARPRKPL
jgi:hypothetical protein